MKTEKAVKVGAALLIALWVYAASIKLMDVEVFRIQLGKSPFLSPFAGAMAFLIPATEIILAVMLSSDRARKAGLYGSLGLLLSFTFYLAALLYLPEEVPCSCGGILGSMSWGVHIIFNLVFAGIAAAAIVLQSSSSQTPAVRQWATK